MRRLATALGTLAADGQLAISPNVVIDNPIFPLITRNTPTSTPWCTTARTAPGT